MTLKKTNPNLTRFQIAESDGLEENPRDIRLLLREEDCGASCDLHLLLRGDSDVHFSAGSSPREIRRRLHSRDDHHPQRDLHSEIFSPDHLLDSVRERDVAAQEQGRHNWTSGGGARERMGRYGEAGECSKTEGSAEAR